MKVIRLVSAVNRGGSVEERMIWLLDRPWDAWILAAPPKVSATLVGPSRAR